MQAAVATQQAQQLEVGEVLRIEDVLRDFNANAHTDLQTLSAQSGIQARWSGMITCGMEDHLTPHRWSTPRSATHRLWSATSAYTTDENTNTA